MIFQETWFILFNTCIGLFLFLDLFIFHKKSHVIHFKEALLTTIFWIVIAFIFNGFVYYTRGFEAALNFFTGYLVEKMLSVDNLFVFLLIFSYFRVPEHLVHKVLFWGIFGAIVMRAFFILFGITLLQQFHGIIYLFGAFLIFTGFKLAFQKEKKKQLESNFFIRLFQRYIPLTPHFFGDTFFVKQGGKLFATPLFLVLLSIETTDLVFAIDSIPAILGITQDPFIVYTSNILAILGLRSLYFVLSSFLSLFHYLHYGLAFILVFIGVKMCISGWITIPVVLSLSVISLALVLSVVASILYPQPK